MNIWNPRCLLKDILFFSAFFLCSRVWTRSLWRIVCQSRRKNRDIHSVVLQAILTKCFFQFLQSFTQQTVWVSQDSLKEVLQQEDTIVTNKDTMWKEYINILLLKFHRVIFLFAVYYHFMLTWSFTTWALLTKRAYANTVWQRTWVLQVRHKLVCYILLYRTEFSWFVSCMVLFHDGFRTAATFIVLLYYF